ncbi:MAG: hypothetical protein QGF94_00965 [Candidatus Thalassarchaeaceae archaeon]|nr:hypothetical protein [Candidatus Thalassarchaeaceae archaeon]
MGIFAPKMLDTPVWAEYGWQGGLPLLLFNGPILIGLAGWGLWRFRASFEVWLLGLWLAIQWALTFVHLFDGLIGISLLTLISYMLYSMALHAFHVPLAVLAGIILAKMPRLTPRMRQRTLREEHVEEEIIADGGEMSMIELEVPPALERRPVHAMMAVGIVSILIAHVVLLQITAHPELEAQTPGDRALHDAIHALPSDSIIYTETAHWGFIYDAPTEIGMTTFPSLGLLTVEERVQWKVEGAIRNDNTGLLSDYGITHAVTSPLGQIGHILAQSEYWSVIEDQDGSRLWRFVPETSEGSVKLSHFVFPNDNHCGTGCDWRPDPWYHVAHGDLEIRPDHVAFFSEGRMNLEYLSPSSQHRDTDLAIHLQHSGPANMEVSVTVCDWGTDVCSTVSKITAGGHEATTVLHHSEFRGEIEIQISIEGGGSKWVNPAGLSGRSDRIIDEEGVWLHWIEVRNL